MQQLCLAEYAWSPKAQGDLAPSPHLSLRRCIRSLVSQSYICRMFRNLLSSLSIILPNYPSFIPETQSIIYQAVSRHSSESEFLFILVQFHYNEVSTLIWSSVQANVSWYSWSDSSSETSHLSRELQSSTPEPQSVGISINRIENVLSTLRVNDQQSMPDDISDCSTVFSCSSLDSLEQPLDRNHQFQCTRDLVASEIETLYTLLHHAEFQCHDTRNRAIKENMTLELWIEFHTAHQDYLYRCIEVIYALSNPAAGEAVKERSSKTMHRMWTKVISRAFGLLKDGSPSYLLQLYETATQSINLLRRSNLDSKAACFGMLGHLARYRAEVDSPEEYLEYASYWYLMAAAQHPEVGYYQHCLATVAQPRSLKKLFHLFKSSTSIEPDPDADKRVDDFFRQVPNETAVERPRALRYFMKTHHQMFEGHTPPNSANHFLYNFDEYMKTPDFEEQGVWITLLNFAAIFNYGRDPKMMSMFQHLVPENGPRILKVAYQYWRQNPTDRQSPRSPRVASASRVAFATLDKILNGSRWRGILPSLYTSLAFLYCFAMIPKSMSCIQMDVPWERLAVFLNMLVGEVGRIDYRFYRPDVSQRLPEDYQIEGLPWSRLYYPSRCFNENNDAPLGREGETALRKRRILCMGVEIARVSYFPSPLYTFLTS